MLNQDAEIADLRDRLGGMRTVMFALALAISDGMPETKPRVVALLRAFLSGAAKGNAARGEAREMEEFLDLLEAIPDGPIPPWISATRLPHADHSGRGW